MRRAAAFVAFAVVFIGGCAAPRNTLGTSASPCFRALPTAQAAVHHQGHFVGVRRMSRTRVADLLHTPPPPGTPTARTSARVIMPRACE